MPADDAGPLAQFDRWYAEAGEDARIAIPNAMTLATADADGRPSARVVLLKGHGEDGFVFYTNLGSPKARDLAANPRASLCFWWDALDRQVRVDGPVEPVSDEAADAYFASRPRGSRIGAWASRQSEVLEGRFELEKRVAKFTAKHAVGAVPRPPFWGGFRLIPETIEFWERRPFRLHIRHRWTRGEDGWALDELYP